MISEWEEAFLVCRRKGYIVLTNEEEKLKPVSMMSRVFVCYMAFWAVRPTLSFVEKETQPERIWHLVYREAIKKCH